MNEKLLESALQKLTERTPDYCLFGIQWWESLCMPRSEWSGFMQAIFSVLAIAVSAGVVWWQVRRQHQLEVQDRTRVALRAELQYVESFTELALLAGRRIDAALSAMDEQGRTEFLTKLRRAAHDNDLISKALNDADHRQMGNPARALALLNVQHECANAFRRVDGVLDAVGSNVGISVDAFQDKIRRDREAMTLHLDFLLTHVAGLRLSLGESLEPQHRAAVAAVAPYVLRAEEKREAGQL